VCFSNDEERFEILKTVPEPAAGCMKPSPLRQ
jgi:hypothetical protein